MGQSSMELERKMNMIFSIVEMWMNTNKLKMNVERKNKII